ncbi:MAG TPA: hypothetical protein VG603_00525 [Chitinophagales bacterium]|nr:hypothetical protein [Chitinophagales bacterium]
MIKSGSSIVLVLLLLSSCTQNQYSNTALQSKVDSLQRQLQNTYKPGLGEFMTAIQLHHAKLWFAGKAQNWELANFEMQEINESVEDAKTYCTDRPEIKSLNMIAPALDSLNAAITTHNEAGFLSGYKLLTDNCNNCHIANQHGFNVIKTPTTLPVTDQEFEKK